MEIIFDRPTSDIYEVIRLFLLSDRQISMFEEDDGRILRVSGPDEAIREFHLKLQTDLPGRGTFEVPKLLVPPTIFWHPQTVSDAFKFEVLIRIRGVADDNMRQAVGMYAAFKRNRRLYRDLLGQACWVAPVEDVPVLHFWLQGSGSTDGMLFDAIESVVGADYYITSVTASSPELDMTVSKTELEDLLSDAIWSIIDMFGEAVEVQLERGLELPSAAFGVTVDVVCETYNNSKE